MQRSPGATAPTGPFFIEYDPPWLIARFPDAQRVLSWAVARPGFQESDCVCWLQVRNADLPVGTDPALLLQRRLEARGLGSAVGLMTSSPLERYQCRSITAAGVHAICLLTLGLSNAERIGMRRSRQMAATAGLGTINALCSVSVPLSDPAMIEALSIATQARTAAILERGYAPIPGAGAVTGTGTDCVVIACPRSAPQQPFAGMHTAIGEALGAAVLDATGAATDDWLRRNG